MADEKKPKAADAEATTDDKSAAKPAAQKATDKAATEAKASEKKADAKPSAAKKPADNKPAAKKTDSKADAEKTEAKPKSTTAKAKASDEKAEGAKKPAAKKTAAKTDAKSTAKPATKPSRRSKPAKDDSPDEATFVRAQARFVRSSPRKSRLVVDHIRGKQIDEARTTLTFMARHVAQDVLKVLNSAVANAEHNHDLDADDLTIAIAYVDEGPTIKRFRPRAKGRATPILKRTSHITIVVSDGSPKQISEVSKRKAAA